MIAKDCGCRRAGLAVINDTEIQRCDDCNLFDTDDDAAAAVDELIKLLGRVYREKNVATVADAFEAMKERVLRKSTAPRARKRGLETLGLCGSDRAWGKKRAGAHRDDSGVASVS